MIKPEMVPEAAAKAAREAMLAGWSDVHQIIAAALSAWPGAFRNDMEEAAGVRRRVILPLPQEMPNDKA